MRRTTGLALGFFFICCAVTGSMVAGLVPTGLIEHCERQIDKKKFVLARTADNLVEVTDARWMFLPITFGDFDLQMDIELSEGAELDLLLRQVEPRWVAEELLPFAGRFSVLRLSTTGDGVGWRTRDEALLGPKYNGVGLAPGLLATVWVEARGRTLDATVAGKIQPPFEADDPYGMLAMIVKGGKAVIHRLEITPLPLSGMWFYSRWTWVGFGMLAGGLVAAIALLLQRRTRLLSSGLGMMVVSWLLLRDIQLDLEFPTGVGMLLALAVPLVFALLVTVRPERRYRWLVVPVLVIGLLAVARDAVPWPGLSKRISELADSCVHLLVDVVADATSSTDSAEIDAVFGPKAGAQISEAHALLVRGHTGLLDIERQAPCVFLLGGQRLYDLGMPADHTALMLERQLRAELRVRVEVAALPTVDGYSSQQWQMFDRFYQAFEPDVVVLGVGADEKANLEGTDTARSSRTQLGETIRAARKSCEEHGRQLVLFADVGVARDILLELRQHEAGGVPLVEAFEGRARIDTIRKLAEVCRPFLKK